VLFLAEHMKTMQQGRGVGRLRRRAGNEYFLKTLKIGLESAGPFGYYPSPCRNFVAAAAVKIFEILKDLN
jgi:hypothetical protein